MNTIFSTRSLRWISLGLVVAAVASPVAQASTRGAGASVSSPLSSDDRLGPKYVPTAGSWPAGPPPQAITTVRPAGFDFGDALIGAGAAALLTAAIAGLVVVGPRVKRSRLHPGSTNVALLVAASGLLVLGPTAANGATRASSAQSNDRYVTVTEDYYVPHVSTVPANAGQVVNLFVREVRLAKADSQPEHGQDDEHATRTKPKNLRRVVLMAGGATQPAMASFNLGFKDYNWMETLAKAGFDVFSLDFTGYGFSPRPTMDNACNASVAEQRSLLIPNPLAATCSPSYPFKLTSRSSDQAELDTVVDYIRELRGVDKVDMIGWSRGGGRVGLYAARHPENVGRLFLYAVDYNRAEPPATNVPEPGAAMTARSVASFFTGWNAQATCPNEVDPDIRTPLAETIMSFDPVGGTWGTQPLWRAPNQTLTGWNAATVTTISTPMLIIGGENDTTVPAASLRAVYADAASPEKVLVHVACAAHQMVWERQHTVLQQASLEWLGEGTFAGETSGVFGVDTAGVATRDQ
jgi:pimeloyl-ACP methyl ester carboxylesterase